MFDSCTGPKCLLIAAVHKQHILATPQPSINIPVFIFLTRNMHILPHIKFTNIVIALYEQYCLHKLHGIKIEFYLIPCHM